MLERVKKEVLTARRRAEKSPPGFCYQRAFRTLYAMRAPTEWVLVHGVVNGVEYPRIGHAWLELGALAYDAVREAFFPAHEYRHRFTTFEHHRFTRGDAVRLVGATGHTGPWYDAEILSVGLPIAKSYPLPIINLISTSVEA
jgi:hypothetical protein